MNVYSPTNLKLARRCRQGWRRVVHPGSVTYLVAGGFGCFYGVLGLLTAILFLFDTGSKEREPFPGFNMLGIPLGMIMAVCGALMVRQGLQVRELRRRIRLKLCLRCGYPHHGLPEARCPECGLPF